MMNTPTTRSPAPTATTRFGRGRADLPRDPGLDRLLGTDWDAELEPFRRWADGQPVARLVRVG